jgi:hypothetical protein
LAERADGSSVEYLVGLDGSLRCRDGQDIDFSRLVQITEKSRPVLGPFLPAWRTEVIRILQGAGFVRAALTDSHTNKAVRLFGTVSASTLPLATLGT